MKINIKFIKTKDLTDGSIDDILNLKKKVWKYSKKEQFIWFKKNINKNDYHVMLYIENNLAGYTPKEHSILKGITRKAIINICKKKGLSIKIGDFKLKDILNSDFVFLSGTAAEIQVVKKINKKKFLIKSNIINYLKDEYKKIKIVSPITTNKI